MFTAPTANNNPFKYEPSSKTKVLCIISPMPYSALCLGSSIVIHKKFFLKKLVSLKVQEESRKTKCSLPKYHIYCKRLCLGSESWEQSPATTPKWHILLNPSFSCCLVSYYWLSPNLLNCKIITQDIKNWQTVQSNPNIFNTVRFSSKPRKRTLPRQKGPFILKLKSSNIFF